VPSRYEHCDLDNFSQITASLKGAWKLCARFCDDYPAVERGLLLQGPCGVGKTHLAVAALKKAIVEKGANGRFYEFNGLLSRILDSYDRRSESTELSVLAPVFEAEVVVLDDLGAIRVRPWIQDTIGVIINERYNAKRLTIVTTNRRDRGQPNVRDGESLADRVGERVRSRLAEMCRLVEMEGDDFRRGVRAADFGRP
jgi:DNA replication protein DnaC